MSIEKTIQRLNILAEVARETMAEEMAEVPLVAIDAEDVEAIKSAAVTLEGLRILIGTFKNDAEE